MACIAGMTVPDSIRVYIAVENTQENRRAYRTLLLTAPGA